jgi:hypothetical protein
MIVVTAEQRIVAVHFVPNRDRYFRTDVVWIVLVVQPHSVLVDFLADGLCESPFFS